MMDVIEASSHPLRPYEEKTYEETSSQKNTSITNYNNNGSI